MAVSLVKSHRAHRIAQTNAAMREVSWLNPVKLRGRRNRGPRNPTGARTNRSCAAFIAAGEVGPLMLRDEANWTR